MKSIIRLSAITILAAFAVAGCDNNKPDDTSPVPSTNAVVSDVNSMAGGTNTALTNAIPVMNTNLPAGTN
jgi:hypothetical protein